MTPGSDAPHAHRARKRPAWTARPGGHEPRARCPRSSLVLGVLVLAAVVSTRWVRLNLSPSVPRGLYLLRAVMLPLPHGTLVLLPAPASIHPWWPTSTPLLKPVAAIAGEEVCGIWDHLWVQGEWYGPVYTEADGKPLPHLEGCVVVPEGAVFLASKKPRSLDGRYFGMTRVRDLTAQAIALWTWR